MEAFMAVMLQPFLLLSLFLSVVDFSSCQPQNIETFYSFDIPSIAPVPSVTNDPPTLAPLPPPTSPQLPPPPPPPLQPSPLPESSSNNGTIVKAVAATAASTLFVAVLFFFAIQKYVLVRRRREKVGDQNSHAGRPPAVVSANDFTRFDGNLKGLIVDENGLDVLYWRKLEEGDKKDNFHKENFHSPRHEEKKKIQEVSLLRGKSSPSHIKIQHEEDSLDQIVTSRPSPAPAALNSIQEKVSPIQQSIVQSPPAAAPPPPVQKKQGPAPPPPPRPPPSVPAKKNPAPPPPPPKTGGLATSLRPPPGPKRNSSDGKVGESSSAVGSGNGQVKLKPLHWDKVNKNVEHSMVWDKIDAGSFR